MSNLAFVDFGRADLSRIFIFGPLDFFADFVAGFFLLIFVGKSAQKNPPGKSPGKILQNLYNKIPDTFLQRGRANYCFRRLGSEARIEIHKSWDTCLRDGRCHWGGV